MAKLNLADAHYNDEANFLDGLLAFHPELFKHLSPESRQALNDYYSLDRELKVDFRRYRQEAITRDATLEATAKLAFSEVLRLAEIDSFIYTTPAED
ncbi:hypothetical protein OG870_17465 [Streptomyces sp. NBC_00461]|uniref:hypothetical protein n=1 Tax=Streptomyces sp. NBC_00461 TaxID=2975750 RepID=UPI002E181A1F